MHSQAHERLSCVVANSERIGCHLKLAVGFIQSQPDHPPPVIVPERVFALCHRHDQHIPAAGEDRRGPGVTASTPVDRPDRRRRLPCGLQSPVSA